MAPTLPRPCTPPSVIAQPAPAEAPRPGPGARQQTRWDVTVIGAPFPKCTQAPRTGHEPVEPAPPNFQPVAGDDLGVGGGRGQGEGGRGRGAGRGGAGLKGAFLPRLPGWSRDGPPGGRDSAGDREFPRRVCTGVVPGLPEPGGPASERAWVRRLPPGPGPRRADRREEGREARGRPSWSLARRRAATPRGRGSGAAAPRAADLGGGWSPAGAANPPRAGGVRRLGPRTRRAQSRAEVGVARGPREGDPAGTSPRACRAVRPPPPPPRPQATWGRALHASPRCAPLGPGRAHRAPTGGPSPTTTTLRPARGPPARVCRPQATHRSDPGAPSVAPPAPRPLPIPASLASPQLPALCLRLPPSVPAVRRPQPCPLLYPREGGILLLLPPSALLGSSR